MSASYNRIAGQSVERLAADGVFAVAMTLLVLDLRAAAVEAVHNEQDLWLALGALAPRLIMCAMTFMTLGIFWVGQQTQLNHLTRSGRGLSWMHILFLFAVSMTPFSTMLLAGFIVLVQLNYVIAPAYPGGAGSESPPRGAGSQPASASQAASR